jgi:molecular chaperone HtpG
MTVGLHEYEGKKLRNIAAADCRLPDGMSDEERKKNEETHKGLIDALRAALAGKVSEVRLSPALKSSPACMVSGDEGISLTMEQTLNESMRGGDMPAPKAKRILELNPDHAVFAKLVRLHGEDAHSAKLRDHALVLYYQSLLAAGLPVEDPHEFAALVTGLLAEEPSRIIV